MRRTMPAIHRFSSLGFTLIELMIVLGIISIMTTLAVSFSGDWRRRHAFESDARHLFQIINIARSEAIRQARITTVSITSTGTAYAFLDADKSGEKTDEEPLVLPDSPRAKFSMTDGRTAQATQSAAQIGTSGVAIAFDMDGLCIDRTGKELAVTITVKDPKLATTYTIDVTVAGALRITKLNP